MNPYEVLGVSRNASSEDIKKAYKELAKKHHPDMHKQGSDEQKEATETFKKVNSAYEILEDTRKRAEYDRFGAVRSGGARTPYTSTVDDFFSSMFGRDQPRQSRGNHILVEHEIDLMGVLNGGEVEIKYQKRSLCKTCNGTGGDQVHCEHCEGSGRKVIHGQAMTVQTVCPACEGTGKSIKTHCGDCSGGFTEPEEQTSSFKVPKGVENGMRFAFRGQGESCADGIAGDLYVVVKVKQNELFERLQNGNILCKMPISYTQLVLGDEVDAPTLTGMVKLKIPAGTQSGTKLRLKDQGLPVFNNNGGIYKNGDEFVQVDLFVPKEINEEQKEILEKLAAIEKAGE